MNDTWTMVAEARTDLVSYLEVKDTKMLIASLDPWSGPGSATSATGQQSLDAFHREPAIVSAVGRSERV